MISAFKYFFEKSETRYNVNIHQRLAKCVLMRVLGGVPWWLSVRNTPAVQETWVRSLGQEDPLEEEMATHSSILAWKIPWTEEPSGLQSMDHKRVELT